MSTYIICEAKLLSCWNLFNDVDCLGSKTNAEYEAADKQIHWCFVHYGLYYNIYDQVIIDHSGILDLHLNLFDLSVSNAFHYNFGQVRYIDTKYLANDLIVIVIWITSLAQSNFGESFPDLKFEFLDSLFQVVGLINQWLIRAIQLFLLPLEFHLQVISLSSKIQLNLRNTFLQFFVKNGWVFLANANAFLQVFQICI